MTHEEALTPTPDTEAHERWLGPRNIVGGSDTVIRKAATRKPVGERVKDADAVCARLEEAATALKPALRLRLYDELIVPQVIPALKDLLGVCVVKKQEEELVHAEVAGGQPPVRSSS